MKDNSVPACETNKQRIRIQLKSPQNKLIVAIFTPKATTFSLGDSINFHDNLLHIEVKQPCHLVLDVVKCFMIEWRYRS